MPQATDIILAGAGYMLAPARGEKGAAGGSSTAAYTRSQDGMSEGRTGRITQRDFFGGQHRAYQLERDRAWDAVGVGPAYGGQGVEPWPKITQVALTGTTPLTSAGRRNPSVLIGDYVYFAVEASLYRTQPLAATTWSTPNTVYNAPATITSIAYYGGNILLGYGEAHDMQHVVYPGATSPATLFAGERAHDIVSYGGFAMWSDARTSGGGNKHTVRQVTGSGLEFKLLDSPIRRLTVAQGKAIAATTAGLYDFAGTVNEVDVRNPSYNPNDANETDPPTIRALRWQGDFEPFFQHGAAVATDDFAFITGFGGRLYAWVGKSVMEYNPSGERAGWRDTGLSGRACFGGCVAAGYLIVAIESRDGMSEVWAWDGAGWWLLIREPISNNRFCWPTPLAGVGGYDVMLFRQGTIEAHLIRLVWRDGTANTFPTSGAAQFITSMIDAGERDKAKAWRKFGAVFAAPEKRGAPGSVDPVGIYLDYSLDGGGTWVNAAGQTVNGNFFTTHNTTLDADVSSDAAVSRFLQLRVRWSSVTDWAPVLVGIWAEFELLDSPARRRRWQFTVTAQDQVIDRDGSQLTRTGRQLIAELWAAWQQGATLPFRDIDFDDDPVQRRVRIIGIREVVPVPANAGRWGQSAVALTLVEV
jgi:hypothetical protein